MPSSLSNSVNVIKPEYHDLIAIITLPLTQEFMNTAPVLNTYTVLPPEGLLQEPHFPSVLLHEANQAYLSPPKIVTKFESDKFTF